MKKNWMYNFFCGAKLVDRITADAGAMRYEFADGTTDERVDPSVPLGTYKDEAWWSFQHDRMIYKAKVRPGFTMHEKLGQVWKKNDGRWNWIRHKSHYQGDWKAGQGVVITKSEALFHVEMGWL